VSPLQILMLGQKAGYLSVAIAFACAAIRYSKLDKPGKIFAIYMMASGISELIAYLYAKKYGNNRPVYAIYSLWEYAIISIYFNQIIDVFHRKNIGYYIALMGVAVGIVNVFFVQGLYDQNCYFLIYEGVTIIIMGLFFFSRLLMMHDDIKLYSYPHFWFVCILVFYWAASFIGWNLYDYAFKTDQKKLILIDMLTLTSSILAYLMGSVVLILYPKISSSHE
jgi:hypothetical protein